jgi:hypothetical protein
MFRTFARNDLARQDSFFECWKMAVALGGNNATASVSYQSFQKPEKQSIKIHEWNVTQDATTK